VVVPVSSSQERLGRAWSSLAADAFALAVRGCRSLHEEQGKSATGESYPVTLDPSCQPAWLAPGLVRVAMLSRSAPVGVNRPVQVRQAVPGSLPLVGPHPADAPDRVPPQQGHVDVSIAVQLDVGAYLGRVDDAMGTGTPFVIYLDGLP